MSQLWPDGNDKSLLLAVIRYLQNLQVHPSIDDENKDSLGVAIDCLQSLSGDSSSSSSLSFTLEDLYQHQQKHSEKTRNNDHRGRFLQFLSVLNEKGYFSTATNDPEQRELLESARVKYNQRCPEFAVGSLDSLQISKDEIKQLSIRGGSSATTTSSSSSSSNNTTTSNTSGSSNTTGNKNKKDNVDSEEKEVSAEAKKQAEEYKTAGNTMLTEHKYKDAVAKYALAIQCDPTNAVYYCNRAAAYTYLKNYESAVDDAQEALRRDPKYVKAYIRLGVAEMERGHLEAARDAYQQAVNLTSTTDSLWVTYVDKLEQIKQKIELQKKDHSRDRSKPSASSGGGAGGMPNWMDMLGGMGGGEAGGMGGLAGLLNNPMMQQMAQQMMSNPAMMQQMNDLMSNPDSMSQLSNMMGDPSFQNLVGGGNDDDSGGGMKELMQLFMQNPEKAKQVMQETLSNPAVRNDPEVEQLVQKMKSGDMSAAQKLATKPHVMEALKKAMNSK